MKTSSKTKVIIRFSLQQVLMITLLLIFLFGPDDLFKATSIYLSSTPRNIAYKWLNYSFSYLYFIPICFGVLISLVQNNVVVFLFPVLLLLRSFFRYICGYESIIQEGTYEIVLAIVVGACLFVWVQYMISTEKLVSQQSFFIWYVLLHVVSQLVSTAYSLSRLTGRFNAINLDVECTGMLCGFAFLYIFFMRQIKYRYLLLLVFAIGELLSGARIPLVIAFTLLIAYIIILPKQYDANLKKEHAVFGIFMIIVAIVLLTLTPDLIDYLVGKGMFSSMTRIVDFTSNGDTSSSIGRIKSIFAGIDILKENPLGLDCGFIFLQRRMNRHGYPTFPHSLILTYYLLIGPFCLFFVLYLFIKKVRNSLQTLMYNTDAKLSSSILFGYLALFSIFTGGPVVNYKVIFTYLLLVSVASLNFSEQLFEV
ncbi:hypothetical protein SAMN04487928_13511 [Butyrivibrio proteoclasticus]|uniref:O-antigen ligase like membrane protein n=1 Tax=Butyrivibrio proteoclasticus TaxID=43305 RepID=A0A1I5XNA8_9FIRM|nr:hypothetical protein [Butyrivibrio proteoclasticus]SFQ33463.1 hypothetical protein SAMN04487928_13511 [Butyrivibrio proteoclasticus]